MMPYLTDSHCHLDRYDRDALPKLLSYAKEKNIHQFITICVDQDNIHPVLSLIEAYPEIYGSVGIHPCSANSNHGKPLEAWLQHHAQNPKIVGLGETGLDLAENSPPWEIQKESFLTHLKVAFQFHLPIIIHMRYSEIEMLQILQNFYEHHRGLPTLVFHCFTGSQEFVSKVLPWNSFFSISGILTFKSALSLQNVAKSLPWDRLLLETDCPWLAPDPYRGKENQPGYMIQTAEKLAALKGISLEVCVEQVAKNILQAFPKIAKKTFL